MLIKIDVELARDFVLDNDGVTQEAADDGATQAVFVRKLIAAHGSETAFGDGSFPRRNVAVVLRVGVLNAADGGDSHAVEVGATVRGVALKIPGKIAVLLGNREFGAGLGDMVPRDVEIDGFEKLKQ